VHFAVARIMRSQLGLVALRQLAPFMTRHQLATELRRGTLLRRRHGVYASSTAPETYERTVLAAVLAAGDESWASHRTAARVIGLRVPAPVSIDVLTPPDRRVRLDGVAHHRSEEIRPADVQVWSGVRTTSVARTLVDCAPFLPGKALRIAVDDARRRKLFTYEQLDDSHRFIDRGRRTGRHLVVPVRPVVVERLPGGSERELDVLDALRRFGVPLPEQQLRVDLRTGPRFLDYGYRLPKVGLEWLGFAEHGLIRSTFDDDAERNAELALAGWLILPFTSKTLAQDLADRVLRALALRAA
jgi:hypothetical protein